MYINPVSNNKCYYSYKANILNKKNLASNTIKKDITSDGNHLLVKIQKVSKKIVDTILKILDTF